MYSCNYRSPVLLNTCQRMDLSMVVLQLRIVWVSVHDNACTYVCMYTVPTSHAITAGMRVIAIQFLRQLLNLPFLSP